jgi:hypothetical protein
MDCDDGNGEWKDLGSVDLGFESGVARSRGLTDHCTCGRGAMNGENAGRTLSVDGALVFLLQLRINRSKRQSV